MTQSKKKVLTKVVFLLNTENLHVSKIKLPFTYLFGLGKILQTCLSLTWRYIVAPNPSSKSRLSTVLVSQGLNEKACDLEVKAPTGHKSITFPNKFEIGNFEE